MFNAKQKLYTSAYPTPVSGEGLASVSNAHFKDKQSALEYCERFLADGSYFQMLHNPKIERIEIIAEWGSFNYTRKSILQDKWIMSRLSKDWVLGID